MRGLDLPGQDESSIGEFVRLGPLGTAFLPSRLPRVLLIDELDKSDFACRTCWIRLPFSLRRPISLHYGRDECAHSLAMSAAFRWYRTHPPTTQPSERDDR